MTKVAKKPAKKAIIREHYQANVASTDVDRDAGVIRNVKLLGKSSRNGRTYSDNALDQAVILFNGKPVYTNHDPTLTVRDVEDQIGWIENVRRIGAEVFGDFYLLLTHPVAGKVLETAERNPRLLGFSLSGSGHLTDGHLLGAADVVDELVEVSSLDLVTEPATTTGLFESQQQKEQPVTRRIREVLVGLPKSAGKTRLLEMVDAEVMSAEMEAPEADLGSEEQALKVLAAAIEGILEKAQTVAEATAMLVELLAPKVEESDDEESKELKEEEKEALEEEEDAVTTAPPEKDQPLQEALAKRFAELERTNRKLQKEVATLQEAKNQAEARESIRKLFEARGLVPTDLQMQVALSLQPSLRKGYIAELTESVATDEVRSSGSGAKLEESEASETAEEFVQRLRRVK